MPRVVDHVARREAIIAALWRVVERDGLAAATVRAVAAEAGLSAGAMRHDFASQEDLLTAAAYSLVERVRDRVIRRVARGDAMELVLAETLALDAPRRAEAAVWMEFVATSRTSPTAHAIARETHEGLRRLAEHALTETTGGALAGSAMIREVDALVALLDGFELHLSLYPQRGQASRVRAALGEHLDAVRARSKASAGRDVPLQLGEPDSGGGV